MEVAAVAARHELLRAALTIVDQLGVSALNVNSVSTWAGVTPKLTRRYFGSTEALVLGTAGFALRDVSTPDSPPEDWQGWLLANSRTIRAELIRRPALAPYAQRSLSTHRVAQRVRIGLDLLEQRGVPRSVGRPLIGTLSTLAISSAVYTSRPGPAAHSTGSNPRADLARRHIRDDLFDSACDAIVATACARVDAHRY